MIFARYYTGQDSYEIYLQVTVLNPNQSVLYTWDDPTEERVLYWNVYGKKSKGFVAKYEKEGFGQERTSVCQIKPPETTNNNLNLIKLITSQTQEQPTADTSSYEDTDSDDSSVRYKVKLLDFYASFSLVRGHSTNVY